MNIALARMLVRSVAVKVGFRVDVLDVGDNYMFVRCVSEDFEQLPMTFRLSMLERAFEISAPKLTKEYMLILEAVTPGELQRLKEIG